MMNWLLIGLGGALGAMGRYGVYTIMKPTSDGAFPKHTLIANLLGCLLIGVMFRIPLKGNEWVWQLLVIGLLGGFTTFSSFGLESFQLIKAGKTGIAVTYMLASTLGGLLCVLLGYGLAKNLQ